MKIIKFKLEEDKHAALDEAASRIHGSVPQVIKLAIDQYLKALGHVRQS